MKHLPAPDHKQSWPALRTDGGRTNLQARPKKKYIGRNNTSGVGTWIAAGSLDVATRARSFGSQSNASSAQCENSHENSEIDSPEEWQLR
jgi:hypothetical protein